MPYETDLHRNHRVSGSACNNFYRNVVNVVFVSDSASAKYHDIR